MLCRSKIRKFGTNFNFDWWGCKYNLSKFFYKEWFFNYFLGKFIIRVRYLILHERESSFTNFIEMDRTKTSLNLLENPQQRYSSRLDLVWIRTRPSPTWWDRIKVLEALTFFETSSILQGFKVWMSWLSFGLLQGWSASKLQSSCSLKSPQIYRVLEL